MEGLGFSIKDLDKVVLKNMAYQLYSETKDANGKSMLTLLADKYDNFEEIYEQSIPTGKTEKLLFKGMDSPENLGAYVFSKIKGIFDKGDNDERLSRAIDNIATNDKDLMKDPRFAYIVQTKRALENLDSTFAADARAILNLEQSEIFKENVLIKKFNELGATGSEIKTIESDDFGLYEKIVYTTETAAGKKSHEVRSPLTSKNDPDGRLLGNSLQGKSSTNLFSKAAKYLDSNGMSQLQKLITDRNLVDSKGRKLTTSSLDMTIGQYTFITQAIDVLFRTDGGVFRLKDAEITAAEIQAETALIKSMTAEFSTIAAIYEPKKNVNDAKFFEDPSTRRELKPLSEIIPDKEVLNAFVADNKVPAGWKKGEYSALKNHLSQADRKKAAYKKIQDALVGIHEFSNKRRNVSETIQDSLLSENIADLREYVPTPEPKEKSPLESLLKDRLQPTRTDPLFNSTSLFTRP